MDRRDTLCAGLLSTGLVLLLLPFAGQGVDSHHDGIMLKPALDVLAGQVLFRDTFSQYGALTSCLQVVALWFNPSLLSLRLLAVAAYGLTLFFLYAAWRLILPRSLTLLSCGLFILFIPIAEKNAAGEYWILLSWSSVFAMMFQSLGLYALFRVIRGEQPAQWGMVLGMTCACVFWCRQPVGVLMFGSLVAIGFGLHWTNWRPPGQSRRSILIRIGGGFIVVNALLLGDILLAGAGPEWWYQNFVWPRKWAEGGPHMGAAGYLEHYVHPTAAAMLLVVLVAAALPAQLKRFRPAISSRSITVYMLLLGAVLVWQYEPVLRLLALRDGGWSALFPGLILLQTIVSVVMAVKSRDRPRTTEYYLVAALAIFALGSLPQYIPVGDPWHVIWALAPAFGLLALVVWRWVGWPARVVALGSTALFVPALCLKTQSAIDALSRPLITLTQPPALRGMKVPPEQAHRFGEIARVVAQVLRHRPDLPSALIGNDALFLCFTNNRTNPSPYFVTWAGLADNTANQERWNNIQRVRPLMFLHKAKSEAVNDFYRRARYVPLLHLPEDALDIAVPQELAEAMGPTAPGAAPPDRAATGR